MSAQETGTGDLEMALRAFIAEELFPCVGAKSAVATGGLQVFAARDVTSAWNDLEIVGELTDWAQKDVHDGDGFRSLAIIFREPAGLSEAQFERAMWDRLQSLADKDAWLGEDYDASVSPEADNPDFALSFGGQAYFVVGLHPNASRPARRFAFPTLIFNLHEQFVRLREEGRYERFRDKIMKRDTDLAGTPNPMLARHGEVSAARQYSGRVVGEEWVCPFQDPRA